MPENLIIALVFADSMHSSKSTCLDAFFRSIEEPILQDTNMAWEIMFSNLLISHYANVRV